MGKKIEKLVAKEEGIEVYRCFFERDSLDPSKLTGDLIDRTQTILAHKYGNPGSWKIVYGPDKRVYEIDLPTLMPTGDFYIARYDSGCDSKRLISNYIARKNTTQDLDQLIKDLVDEEFRIRHEFNEKYGVTTKEDFGPPYRFGETEEYWEAWQRRWEND